MSTDHGTVFGQPRDLGPQGLCADRDDHRPHLHESASLGRFRCTADQDQREPHRSQRRQDALRRPQPEGVGTAVWSPGPAQGGSVRKSWRFGGPGLNRIEMPGPGSETC